ncbi:n-terminal domain protein [Ichthyophthirius multifiliis]|uniref:N-terminal domain protein n=1 Tax=Ichthyophthirius multifiliis TaxID=5932 RepID=G0QYN6_ICHMU|nr:n-terminal domain protein [Ichthyophthirius multifiliis]EGR29663.1 n-terminal domain protein [Ichthyophthirius multifiliis]|eukprot:XP_004030899.1 n-terminal domain protein [Ichthyophthirius multifiliis]
MRAILIDWMMEVSMEFMLKRDTFYNAQSIIDRYLQETYNVKKTDLQLIGVTALYIASKIEEIDSPNIQDFVRSTDNGYTDIQVKQTEITIVEKLNFRLNPPTYSMWCNWFMCQWDIFVENSSFAQNSQLVYEYFKINNCLNQFKQPNEQSYSLYREFMQIIDCSIMNIKTIGFEKKIIIASLMYLVLGKSFKVFNTNDIVNIFQDSYSFLLDPSCIFNELFQAFLNESFGLQLLDLLHTIQYLCQYFTISFNFDLPRAAKINQESLLQVYYIFLIFFYLIIFIFLVIYYQYFILFLGTF